MFVYHPYCLYRIGFWVVGILLLLLTVPITLYFVYTVAKDPVTPTVLRNAWDIAKRQYFGYLGNGEQEENQQPLFVKKKQN